ncbi:hypothetical protein [Ruminococcus sp.]|uniref:hypothetical protein n=1 Tax=Ruminococcus sp. TaxID=41978 RepID=UPI0025CBE903|nr:hypothetical protein [Ruminococcus sp.]
MKKINILPLVEKEVDYSLLITQVRKGGGIAVSMLVYIILFAVICVIGLIKPLLSLPLVGILFILPGIDNSGTIYQNGRAVENNAKNRLPLLIIGIFVTLFGICGSLSMYDKSIAGFAAKIVLALMIVTIASITIGRLIYLIVLSAAALGRKNSCTCPVPYEHDDYAPDGTNIYKYYYEGECYHFMDHDGSIFAESTGLDNTIMIDPDSPERYYLKSVFGHYCKSLWQFIVKLIMIVLFTSPVWGAFLLKFILGRGRQW